MNEKVEIYIEGKDGLSKPLQEASKALGHLDDSAKRAGRSLGGTIKGLVGGLGQIGLAGLGISALTGAVTGLATGMIAGNAEFERYETQFGVLLGSAKAAKDRLEELTVFGATTPFELPGVVVADKILQGFGLHSEEAAKKFGFSGKEIRRIAGDVAAGSGAAFDQMAGYIGKFASGATGEAIMRFQELGIVNREQLANMGLEFAKSGELMSPLPKAMNVLLTVMKQKYGGMMDAQSKTFEGMMSNLTDWIGNTKRKLMAPLFEVLKDKLQGVLEFLGSPAVTGALDSFAQMLASGMSTAITTLSTLGDIMGDLLGVFGGAEDAGLRLHNALERLVGLDAANFLIGLIKGAKDIKDALGPLVDTILKKLGDAFNDLGPTGKRLSDAFNAIKDAVGSLVPTPLGDIVSGFAETATNSDTLKSALKLLTDAINAISSAIEAATKFVADHKEVQAALVGIIAPIAAIFVAIKIAMLAQAVATGVLTAATGLLTAAQTALNVVMAMNPIAIVVLALIGLVAALVYAYNTSEDFRRIVDGVWKAIKDSVETVWKYISGVFDAWVTYFTETLPGAANDLRDLLGAALDWLGEDAMAAAAGVGRAIIDGIINGINAGWRFLTDLVGNLAGDLLNAAKRALGIGSPSKEFFKIGEQIINGLVAGIESRNTSFIDAVRATLRDSISMMESLIDRMVGGPSASILGRGASALKDIEKLLPYWFNREWLPKLFGSGGLGAEISRAAESSKMLGQVKDVVAAMQEMGMTIDDTVIAELRRLGENLGGPFKEQLERFLNSLPAQEAMKGLRAILEEADLARQLASTASMLQSLGQTMPATMRAILEALPREAGGILDTIIKQLLAGVIPGFQHGGTMVRSGLALVGERGPELLALPGRAQVMPLSGTNMLDIDYDRLAAALSAQPIVVRIDGEDLVVRGYEAARRRGRIA